MPFQAHPFARGTAVDDAAASPATRAAPTAEADRRRLHLALSSLELARASGRPWALAEAHREAAAAYRGVGALSSAVALLDQAVRWARATGGPDQCVDLQCELVETLARQAEADDGTEPGTGRQARERARDLVFEASRLAARVSDDCWEVTVLLRLSDVLDRFGDRDEATLLQVRALRLTVGATFPPDPHSAASAAPQRSH